MVEALSGTALAHWRRHPQQVKGNLVVWVPGRVIRRRVNQASFTYPISQLTFDNPDSDTGSTSDVEADMMVHVLDSSGIEKGWGRILKDVSGSTIYIHPVGRGDIDFANNDILDVYEHYVPYSLIPYIDADGTLYKNYDEAYTDQTDDFPPVANAGPARAGFVDSGDVLTVELDASGSYAVADGATLSSYSWDIADGTVTSGSTSSSSLTVTFPAGKRWIKLTVTDSNGKTALARVPIYAADGDEYPVYKAALSRRSYSHALGWEASFQLFDTDVSAYPEHALVIYWEEERFGSHQGSLNGYSDAEHVKLVGYVTDELLTINAWTSDVVINVRSPLALLANRPAFPQTAKRDATPSNWAEVKGLTWWRMVVYLLKWHSNILELCDLERPSFYGDYNVVRLDSELGSLYDQVAFLARSVSSRFTSDRHGRFYIRRIPHLMTDTDRANWTPLVALTSADLVDDGQGVQFERPGWDTLAWLRAEAIVEDPSTPTAVLAVAPGDTPGQGLGITTFDRLLVTSQSDLNERTGHEYAYRQSRRDGRRVIRRGTLTLAHRGDVIDPAWQRVVTLTLAASTNRRGLSFSADRMVPVSLDVAYDHRINASLETLVIEAETKGAPATTEDVPTDTVNDWAPPEYVAPVSIDPQPDANIPSSPDLVYAADEATIRRTTNFTDATPTWTTLFTATADVGASYIIYSFRVDKHAPKTRATVVVSDGSDTKIYLTEDLSAASPTWTLKQTLAHACLRSILYSAHGEGTLEETWVVTVQDTNNSLHVIHTHDHWDNITDVSGFDPRTSAHGMDVSGHAASSTDGMILVSHRNVSPVGYKKSTDYGGTFPTFVSPSGWDTNPPNCIVIPWIGNDDDLQFFMLGGSTAGYDAYVKYTANGGTGWSDITPAYDYGAGAKPFGGGRRTPRYTHILHTYTPDPDVLALIGSVSQDKYAGVNQRFFRSDDRGSTWTMMFELSGYAGYAVGGWPYDPDTFFISCSDRLLYTTDSGTNLSRKEWAGYSQGVWIEPIWIE